jgi:hypothetical protein
MCPRRIKFFCLLLISSGLQAQAILSPTGDTLALWQPPVLHFPKENASFLLSGKIWFSGTSPENSSIYLLFTPDRLSDTKAGYLYPGTSKQPEYQLSSGTFSRILPNQMTLELLRFKAKDGQLLLQSGNKILAILPASAPTGLALFMAARLDRSLALTDSALSMYNSSRSAVQTASSGTIRELYGSAASEWIFENGIIRPRWNANPRCAWSFDGTLLRPLELNLPDEEYEWDGQTLSPVWGKAGRRQWTSDGTSIHPMFDSNWNFRYEIQGKYIRAPLSNEAGREWLTDGELPLPIIVAIVSGTLRCL